MNGTVSSYERSEEFISRRAVKYNNTEKSTRILGQDSFSREKLIDTLGIDNDDILQAEEERVQRLEEQLSRNREFLKNKKEAQKALDVLGEDFSNRKLRSQLGLEEEELLEAIQNEKERQEEEIRRIRRRQEFTNRRRSLKALDVMGVDPSEEKIKNFFGMDIQQYREEQIMDYEIKLSRKRSLSALNRRSTLKAQRVLGIYPSQDKLIARLGIDTTVMQEISAEQVQGSKKQSRDVECTLIDSTRRTTTRHSRF